MLIWLFDFVVISAPSSGCVNVSNLELGLLCLLFCVGHSFVCVFLSQSVHSPVKLICLLSHLRDCHQTSARDYRPLCRESFTQEAS